MVLLSMNDLKVLLGNQLGKLHGTLPECSQTPGRMISTP